MQYLNNIDIQAKELDIQTVIYFRYPEFFLVDLWGLISLASHRTYGS